MKNNIFKSLILFFAVTTFSSCLKDDSLVLDPEKGHNVIEFANTTDIAVHGSTIPLYMHSFAVADEVSMPVTVSYSGPEATAPTDITVNIAAVDENSIESYNEEQGTEFELMPASNYTLSATSVVIPKGSSKASFTVKYKTNAFDLDKLLVLPLKITSVSSGIISGNFGRILLNVNPKNKYDGTYTVTATAPMVDLTSSALTGYYPMQKMTLITTGANSVVMYDGQYFGAGYYHPIASGTAISAYGSFSPVFTMDAAGKVVAVTNYFGQPAANGRSGLLNPSGVNQFTVSADGKTKTLEVSYYMLQPGTAIRTSFHEKWVFTGER